MAISAVSAATNTVAAQPAESATPRIIVTEKNGHKLITLKDGIVIEGKIQKPLALYILGRTPIGYDWEQLKQDFTAKIRESVKRSPF